jgi:murein DD-endopeptidase MepM/ murein hydrolase activator NlpD
VGSTGESRGKGRTIILDHGQEIKTQYEHLSEILVSEGDHVRKGQRIALVGNSGKSTGPHLHYEVRVNGIPIDPRKGLMSATPGE